MSRMVEKCFLSNLVMLIPTFQQSLIKYYVYRHLMMRGQMTMN